MRGYTETELEYRRLEAIEMLHSKQVDGIASLNFGGRC